MEIQKIKIRKIEWERNKPMTVYVDVLIRPKIEHIYMEVVVK